MARPHRTGKPVRPSVEHIAGMDVDENDDEKSEQNDLGEEGGHHDRARGEDGDALSQQEVTENEVGDEEDGNEEDGREEGEEGRQPVRVRAPQQVSKEERDAHELTHTPYRAWCRHCVRARGRNAPHKKGDRDHEEGCVPKISMDYFFMSKVDESANVNPFIVMLDEDTGEKYARAVGHKGLGQEREMEWLIKDMSMELKSWGHPGGDGGHIILKADGEKSIIAVRDALARYHGGKVVPEGPPKGESQSNGAVEEAGKTVREFVRVLKEHLEYYANMQLKCDDVITLWMIRWSAMLCSRYLVGKDGLTAYERRRGRKCRVPVVAFGEKVWYKELRTGKARKNKFDSEWQEGIWVGHHRESNEAIIGTTGGFVRAYAIKRRSENERWDSEMIKNLKGTPQQPDPSKPGLNVPIKINFDPPVEGEFLASDDGPDESQVRRIRRMRITQDMLNKYGYTEGCDGCRYKRAGFREHREHNPECRARIDKAMHEDEVDKDKWEKNEERINWRMAEQMEKTLEQRQTVRSDENKQDLEADVEGEMGDKKAIQEQSQQGTASSGSSSSQARGALQGRKRKTEDEDDNMELAAGKIRRSGAQEHADHAEILDEDMETPMIQSLRRISVDIAEMYSPPRVTAEAKKFGMQVGEAMDFATGWDFSRKEDREKAMEYINKFQPKLVVGSPMCHMLSQLQRLSQWNAEKQRRWREDREHLKFMASIYKHQVENGKWFLHIHPAGASSWSLKEIQDVLNMLDVGMVVGDQCMYGLKTWGMNGKEQISARKRTGFMSNSRAMLNELTKKCDGAHEHQWLLGSRAKQSGKYPDGLCRAICVGLMKEIRNNEMKIMKLIDVNSDTKIEAEKLELDEDDGGWSRAWDDVSGEELDPEEVKKARREEMKYIKGKGVRRVVTRQYAAKH